MKYWKRAQERDRTKDEDLERSVAEIIARVRRGGDEALVAYNTQFDGNTRTRLRVGREEIEKAYRLTDARLIGDLRQAAANIERFALRQKESLCGIEQFEALPGVFLGQRIVPVESACCYVPGGGYPLYSTALMLAVTARVAGVRRIAMCAPAVSGTESIHPSTLIAMDLAGAHEIYALSGVHAVAAFTHGTEQIRPVDLIVGPGNQYVTEAKRQCFGKIGIDFLAGPSEILIIAGEHANAEFIAADLISETEHDVLAVARLITTSEDVARRALESVECQLCGLETEDTARAAWDRNGEILVVDTVAEACELANHYAPEHLVLRVDDEDEATALLHNYGSLFYGESSSVVFSDYYDGANHTLPTARTARYTGGVWVGTFCKVCTNQRLTPEGAGRIAAAAARLAEGEGLPGHAHAAELRGRRESARK